MRGRVSPSLFDRFLRLAALESRLLRSLGLVAGPEDAGEDRDPMEQLRRVEAEIVAARESQVPESEDEHHALDPAET
jgi:hypothetical protein